MNEDEVPLEVRPRMATPAATFPALGEAIELEVPVSREEVAVEPGTLSASPWASPPLDDPSSLALGTSNSPLLGLPDRGAENSAGPDLVRRIFSEASSASFGVIAGPAQGSNRPDSPDKDLPMQLSPTAEPRLIAEVPPAVRQGAGATSESSRVPGPFWVVFVVSITLAGLYLARTITRWGGELAALHPALAYALYGSVGVLLGMLAWSMARQVRSYWGLTVLDGLRGRLEQARTGQASQSAAEQLRREFQAHIERLRDTGVISDDVGKATLALLHEPALAGMWVERASARLLQGLDAQVKQEIEREARRVGVVTALSPSGPLDTLVVLWRGAGLILRIAQIYGVRPGGYGSYRLFRRVTAHMVVAGLSEEALHLLYAAYGPAAAEAAAKGLRSVFDLMSKGGLLLAPVEPLTGGLLAAGGAVGKGAADAAGTAVALATGPLLQGVLNAVFTLRIGLAAQHECRLLALTSQEQRAQSAGLVSALLGFFRSVRRPVPSPAVSIGERAGAD